MTISITKAAAICSLGENLDEIFSNVAAGKLTELKINTDLPKIQNKKYDLRCNQLLLHCVNQLDTETLTKKYDKKRIGVVIATTNTGIDKYETDCNLEYIKMSNPAEFLREHLGLDGYFCGISTACSSGIKVFSTAKKLLENGICDAVIAGGTDELSNFPVAGFSALEVLSDTRSIPMSKNRKGMNISEAAALFILEQNKEGIIISGIGETSDAYHISTPDPKGIQASQAIKNALKQAKLSPQDIDYINLHGTGTISNDIMEANAVYNIFKDITFASSTKPLTGHCLGASASIEVAICYAALCKNKLPVHIFDGEYDSALPPIKLVKAGDKKQNIKNVMCNAFGFGGTNAVLILSKKYNLEKILPHDNPMILIDDIIEVNLKEKYIISEVTINNNKIFFDKELDGISYLTGIEFMAQTIGCYAYLERGEDDTKIGFLLGARSYSSNIEKFENGKTYTIKAKAIFGDNQLVSFECFIYNDNEECAKAVVNVYQPEDASEFLAE